MIALGMFATALLAFAATVPGPLRTCLRKQIGKSEFNLNYRSPLKKKVPHMSAFDVRYTHVEVERMPNLTLRVRCDSNRNRMRHMRNIWRAFPQLARERYDMSDVY